MNDKPQNGIRSTRNPRLWTVPPWPGGADVHAITEHFRRFSPACDATSAELLTYYETYVSELEAAYARNPGALRSSSAERWYQDFRSCLARCVESYRRKCKEERNRTVTP